LKFCEVSSIWISVWTKGKEPFRQRVLAHRQVAQLIRTAH